MTTESRVECARCKCAAMCLALGKDKFFARVDVCPECRALYYLGPPRVFEWGGITVGTGTYTQIPIKPGCDGPGSDFRVGRIILGLARKCDKCGSGMANKNGDIFKGSDDYFDYIAKAKFEALGIPKEFLCGNQKYTVSASALSAPSLPPVLLPDEKDSSKS